jgi:hypothetical protein
MLDENLHRRTDEFRAALEFTSAETGFSAHLIKKDYWCSLVLREFFAGGSFPLVFKGGTLLSKAYAGFGRLSEDLDFTLPTLDGSTRGQRSRRANEVGAVLNGIVSTLGLHWTEGWRGHNNSTHYSGHLSYPSILGESRTNPQGGVSGWFQPEPGRLVGTHLHPTLHCQ